MKLVSFEVERRQSYGIAVADGVIDAGVRLGTNFPDLRSVIAADGLEELRALSASESADYALGDIDFLPVIPNPEKIFCVGINYRGHVEETGREFPAYPLIFLRVASSLTGHGRSLMRPTVSSSFDYEGELAVIIGRGGRGIAAENALQHIAGYACFNDGSVRDYQRHSSQFTAGKNFDNTGGFGPWLTTADEIADPAALALETRLNSIVVQRANVAELIFDIRELIRYCSSFATLGAGDVIVTGTPGGVGFARKPPLYLQPGDTIAVEVPGVGILRNSVSDEIDASR